MRFKRLLAAALVPFIMVLNCPIISAQAVKQSTQIFHKPIESAEAGERITLYTEISDQDGIDVVRVYFKSKDAENYNFIELKQVDNQERGFFEQFKNLGSEFTGQGYTGVLPAPANQLNSFEYLILIKNKANTVVKSQTYTVNVVDEYVGRQDNKEPLLIYTELPEAPMTIAGFSDNYTIYSIEPYSKYGVIAGFSLGDATDGGGASPGGTIAASTGEFTRTAALVGGAAVIAVVGGLAAVAGGGGGDGGSSNSVDRELNSQTIVGEWISTERGVSATTIINSNGTYYSHIGGRISNRGNWTLTGNRLTFRHLEGLTWTATVSGNSNAFTAYGPSTVHFKRK